MNPVFFAKFPAKFPATREFDRGDRFADDCVVSHRFRFYGSGSAGARLALWWPFRSGFGLHSETPFAARLQAGAGPRGAGDGGGTDGLR